MLPSFQDSKTLSLHNAMRQHVHNIFWFWLPPIAYMLAIFFMSAQSNPQIGGETPDYVLHALEYFLLALWLIRLLLSRPQDKHGFTQWQRLCLTGMLLTIAYGVTDEIHQYFIPGRHCSLHDILADSFGAFAAYAAGCLDYGIFTGKQAWLMRLRSWKPLTSISYAVARLK